MKAFIPRYPLALWFAARTVTAAAGLSYSWTGSQPIPDNDISGVAYSFNVSDPATTITNVAVTLNIANGFNGDLYAYLSHGDGFAVLLNRAGRTALNDNGYSTPGMAVTLSGLATADIHNYQSYGPTYNESGELTGTWAEDGRVDQWALDTSDRSAPLAGFNGMDPNGDWTLYICDTSPVGISTLVSWSVEISVPPTPPAIASQPGSQTVPPGSAASLTVTATGTGPFSYQWFKNGRLVIGATNSTLSIASAVLTDSGFYYAVITTAAGLTLSRPATVLVGAPQLLAWGNDGSGQLGDGSFNNKTLPESVATNVLAGAGGEQHSLYVMGDGSLWAMGDNTYGELGDGTTTGRSTAALVLGASNVVAVAAGRFHSLFLRSDGTLWGMGFNWDGELGDGTATDQSSPELIASNVVAMAGGYYHSLYLTADGTLWAMGYNGYGQLGQGDTSLSQTTPVTVASNVVAVAAGGLHSLYLTADGTLWATGDNESGQLGNGTTTEQDTPVAVAGNVVAMAAGYLHSLYLDADNTMWGMGDNGNGQLGDGTGIGQSTPEVLSSNVVAIASDGYASFFFDANANLWATGDDSNDELGAGSGPQQFSPVAVTGMSLANLASGPVALHTLAVGVPLPPAITVQPTNQTVSAGSEVTLTVGAGGFAPLAYQWQLAGNPVAGATASSYILYPATAATAGDYTVVVTNLYGSVTSAVATLTVNPIPAVVIRWPTASPITYGESLAASTLSGGSAEVDGAFGFTSPSTVPETGTCWQNISFIPGDTNSYTAVSAMVSVTVSPTLAVSAPPTNQTVANGGPVNLTVTAGGSAPFSYQWFKNGGLVIGATNSTLSIASAVLTDSGVYYALITNAAGLTLTEPAAVLVGAPQLLAWGNDGSGQLGDGSFNNESLPESVATNVLAAAAGQEHSLYLMGDGSLWAMGDNSSGQLGDGTTTGRSTAAPVLGASNVVAVAAGSSHSLFLRSDGTLWGMGWNGDGELGDGTTTDQTTPELIGSNVVSVAAGGLHSLYLTANGTLWGKGYNGYGQFGQGDVTYSQTTPLTVATNVVSLSAGGLHSLYLTVDGTLWAMGDNESGQLGNGTTTEQDTPVAVASNVVAMAAGYRYSLYLDAGNTLWGMGDNSSGQLGDGTGIDQSTPEVLSSNVVAIATEAYASFFFDAAGNLWATGDDESDELGAGNGSQQLSPVAVTGMSLANLASGPSALHTLAVGMPLPPAITVQPTNQTVSAGSEVTLSVGAGGFAPLAYQWQLAGNPVAGATASSYTLNPAMAATAGDYTVVVTNLYGSVTSAVATLTVNPVVAQPPVAIAILNLDGMTYTAFQGTVGAAYVIYASTNLTAPDSWSAMATNLPDSDGMLIYFEPTAWPQRFFRAAAAPSNP